MTKTYRLIGTHCAACIKVCSLLLKKLPGITAIADSGQAALRIESAQEIPLSVLESALKDAGYGIKKIINNQ
ncbi:MAG: hypothetical protein WC641_01790 [Patescibacteria group bacterium]